MGLVSDSAAYIPAPKVGTPKVVAVSDVVTAAIDTGITEGNQWFTFQADVDTFLTFGKTNSETDPNPTAVAGDSQAWTIYANTTADYLVNSGARFMKAICNTGETGFLRRRISG